MSQELLVRTAGERDLVPLLELYQHLTPSDPHPGDAEARRIWKNLARFEGSAIYVGAVCDRLVSTCTLVVVPNLTRGGASYALIENVVTHADHRKRGYGQAVLKRAINAAWDHGCYKVMLLTGSKNPATLGFYETVGFQNSKTGFEIRRLPPRQS